MRSLILTIFTICFISLPVFGWATNPSTENKSNESTKQSEHIQKADEPAPENKPSSDDFQNKQSPEKGQDITENNSDNASLSKFNYLLYFIYKHKYQDTQMTDLEEKI